MKSPEQFYKDEIASLTSKEKALQRKSNIYVACKLILFCCIIASIWYTVGNKGNVPGFISIAISVILYVAALKADAILNRKIRDLQSRRKVCENELSYFRNDFSPFEDGTEFIDPHHKYSYDLDVFGPESLFNRINRTVTLKGKEMLARKLTDLPSDTDIIHKRQEAVKELAALPQWRIKFHSNRHIGKELDRLADVIAKPIQGNLFMKDPVPQILSIVTVLSLAGWLTGFVSPIVFCSLFVLQHLITFFSGRRTDRMIQFTDSLYKECRRYTDILKDIETAGFKSELLIKSRQCLFDDGTGSLKAFDHLSRILNLYDQRGNFLLYLLFNGTIMYDIMVSKMFFKWISKYGSHITGWTDSIAEIDALASFGTYVFNNPDNTYGEILAAPSGTIIETSDIVHPFLSGRNGVPNSFTLKRDNLAIVTGANMAGKSTFLRTIGVSFILATNGAAVCARKFAFVPVSLFSSMRTADNLSKDTSYFQAELSRLRLMLEYVKSHTYTLVILDEILKGTNSSDKLKGSMIILEELSRHEVSGIIATHDLGITDLENRYPDKFLNYCFEIELSDTIRFSYKISRGVARNMNASHLIEIMLDKI
ncbi:MAG: DNA mismatch repair protein MutS [Bacteroidetes bacterium]|uniref:DNA mismatch repair protein MutS n=1 Tax=Candidatus Cryptobacteroides avicola TaxID=2840757 RepID=A0A940DTC6_9BACT|nr:DNA mismatch repair protein MutS [Candidatus Cryptobacteroides avicola]